VIVIETPNRSHARNITMSGGVMDDRKLREYEVMRADRRLRQLDCATSRNTDSHRTARSPR
jgi:hypothetical protein